MARVKLKYGEIELEYDGPEDFLKAELTNLITAVSSLHKITPPKKSGQNGGASDAGGETSVSTIAQQLDVKSGSELIMAAALSLARSGKQNFSKKDLRACMRQATVYWKAAYASNFDTYVARLVKKGRLNHTGGTNHSLPADELNALNQKTGAAA